MTGAERKARALLKSMSTECLLQQWELTTENNEPEIFTVRGWIMDEIEERHPEAFNAWLESKNCEDAELANYILTV